MEPFTLILAAALAQTTAAAPPPRPAAPPPAARPMPADKDGNGTISRQEFLNQAAERFARMDTNRDGQLTREERRAARQDMREKRGGPGGRHRGPHRPGDMPPPPPPGAPAPAPVPGTDR